MLRSFVVVLLAFLLACPTFALDAGHRASPAWELSDDSAASLVLDDGVASGPVIVDARPAPASTPYLSGEPSAPRRQSLPPTPGRAPPVR